MPKGDIVPDGVAEQTAQALRNVLSVLAAVDAGPSHVAKMTVYLAADADMCAVSVRPRTPLTAGGVGPQPG